MKKSKTWIGILIVLVLAVVLAGTAVAVGYNMFDWWKPPRFRVEEPKETVQAEPDSSMQREESHQPVSSEEESGESEDLTTTLTETESRTGGPGIDPNTRLENRDVDIEEAREFAGKSFIAAEPDREFLGYTLQVIVTDWEDYTSEEPHSLEYRYQQGKITIGLSEYFGWTSLGTMQPQSYAGQQINVNDRYVDPEGREMRSYMMRTKMGHPMTAVFSREIPAEEVFERMLSLRDV